MQITAMTHIAMRDPDVPIPCVSSALDGGDVLTLPDESGPFGLVWPGLVDRALASLVAGYHAAFALGGAELDLLWPLIRARLAVSDAACRVLDWLDGARGSFCADPK